MSEQDQLAAGERAGSDEPAKHLWFGMLGAGIMYAMAGVFSILGSLVMAGLPWNTPGIYDQIGKFHNTLHLRFGTSTAFFAIAAATIIIGYFYCKTPAARWKTWAARVVAIVQQPWVSLVFVTIAALWLVQVFDPSGDVAKVFAAPLGLDVGTVEGRLEYQFMIAHLPSFAFMFFGVLSLMLLPFTFFISSIVLQDTGMVLNKRRRVEPMSFEQKARMYACKGLLIGGIMYMLVGAVFYGIGYIFSIGIDLTYPLLSMWNYRLYLEVYPWFPVAFGAFCMLTAFVYYFKPTMPASRIMAWTTVAVQCVIPLFGWFFAIVLGRELWYSGQQGKGTASKRQTFLGIVIGAAIVVATLLVVVMLSA